MVLSIPSGLKHNDTYYPGKHKPLVSEEMFNAAQKVTEGYERIPRNWRFFPLAGLVECDECKSTMTPHYVQKSRKGKKTRYFYYRCTCNLKQDWNSCSIRQVNAKKLESYLFSSLERIAGDPQFLENLAFRLNHEFNSESSKKTPLSGGKGPREGFELSSDYSLISGKDLGQTLDHFVKNLVLQKGLDANLWSKKFIEKVIYSKSRIQIYLAGTASSDCGIPSEYNKQSSSYFLPPPKKRWRRAPRNLFDF